MENRTIRQDAWSEEDDLTLAEVTLRHIREGSTQLKAFDEAAKVLNRTPAACGFRWNSEVRKRYENEIAQAKQERKERRKLKVVNTTKTKENNFDVIFKLKSTISELENLIEQIMNILEEKDKKIEQLKKQLAEQKPEIQIEEEYKQFVEILKRAREMGILEKIS